METKKDFRSTLNSGVCPDCGVSDGQLHTEYCVQVSLGPAWEPLPPGVGGGLKAALLRFWSEKEL